MLVTKEKTVVRKRWRKQVLGAILVSALIGYSVIAGKANAETNWIMTAEKTELPDEDTRTRKDGDKSGIDAVVKDDSILATQAILLAAFASVEKVAVKTETLTETFTEIQTDPIKESIPEILAETTTALNMSPGQEHALKEANTYLAYSSFSYDGLVRQLEYEGFSKDEAIFAAENCGTDWRTQAQNCARDYLRYGSFSHQGLYEQLRYEGFSSEDAAYAVENCGADWNEQAAKTAQGYLDYSSFSRKGLMAQLEYEGFSSSEVAFAIQAVGY